MGQQPDATQGTNTKGEELRSPNFIHIGVASIPRLLVISPLGSTLYVSEFLLSRAVRSPDF